MTQDLASFGLKFHHLGLAVKEPEMATSFLAAMGYNVGKAVNDPLQNVNLIMCAHANMPDIEIIYPADGPGPVDKLLQRHKNGIVYHLCYETDSHDDSMRRIEESGFRLICVAPLKPAVLFGGKPVAFYFVNGVGLIEIIDNSSEGANAK